MMRGDDPRWGCVYPGCTAHPANPDNGGPIFRLSPEGTPWIGACGEHYEQFDAPYEPALLPEDQIPMTPDQVALVRAQRKPR